MLVASVRHLESGRVACSKREPGVSSHDEPQKSNIWLSASTEKLGCHGSTLWYWSELMPSTSAGTSHVQPMNEICTLSQLYASDAAACSTSSPLLARTPTSVAKSAVPSHSAKASESSWKPLTTFSSRHFVRCDVVHSAMRSALEYSPPSASSTRPMKSW